MSRVTAIKTHIRGLLPPLGTTAHSTHEPPSTQHLHAPCLECFLLRGACAEEVSPATTGCCLNYQSAKVCYRFQDAGFGGRGFRSLPCRHLLQLQLPVRADGGCHSAICWSGLWSGPTCTCRIESSATKRGCNTKHACFVCRRSDVRCNCVFHRDHYNAVIACRTAL